MLIVDFLLVLALALAFTFLLLLLGPRSGPRPSTLGLVLVLLLGAWALAVWLRPIGPAVRGVYLGSFLVATAAAALFLAVAGSLHRSPREKSRNELRGVRIRPMTPADEQLQEERAEAAVATSLRAAFWIFILAALLAIVAHYAFPGHV